MKKFSKYLVLFVIVICATSCNSCSSESPSNGSGYNVSFHGEKSPQRCYICVGDGKCNRCGGDGMIHSGYTYLGRCESCKGTGLCPACGGDGIMNN